MAKNRKPPSRYTYSYRITIDERFGSILTHAEPIETSSYFAIEQGVNHARFDPLKAYI